MNTLSEELMIAAMRNVPKEWSQPMQQLGTPQEQGRAAIDREVHHQLWRALCSIAANHYGLGGKIGMSPQSAYGEELMIATIHCLDKDVKLAEYRAIAGEVSYFLEELKTFAEDNDGHFEYMASQGIGLTMIEYDPEVFYDTLSSMLNTLYPDDTASFAHLNAIWHLEERLALGPANKLS